MPKSTPLNLLEVGKHDPFLRWYMQRHYSAPKGFVGRSICYRVEHDSIVYGAIVGGSCTLHLPGRDDFFSITDENRKDKFLRIINNVFYHIEPVNGKYPLRNFTVKAIEAFRLQIVEDWKRRYNSELIGFETLVELPRSGEIYKRDKWEEVGLTKGYTCKRIGGIGTDNWGGKRIWNYTDLRKKRVFCRMV